MEFELDDQTVKDLEIFRNGSYKTSIFDFYNQTKTNGGKAHLIQLMSVPLAEIEELKERCGIIKHIAANGFEIKFTASQFNFIDHYLKLNTAPLRNNPLDAFVEHLSYRINPTNNYYLIQSGVQQLVFLFSHLNEKFNSGFNANLPTGLSQMLDKIQGFMAADDLKEHFTTKKNISYVMLNKLDYLFRKKYRNELIEVIELLYILDALISVGKVAREKKLAFPEYVDSPTPILSISNLYHPLLEHAVSYEVEITGKENLCFLTGPNMAGKSTFLKSVGLSIYITHLGFPVPASYMKTSVYHGLISTINLDDSRERGYSHFFSEVKRVKETALKIKEKKKVFVIFDELFRGTNVKDAFEGSLAIMEAFARIRSSTFFVSTHITEVAGSLKKIPSVQFKCFDSQLIKETPTYDYKLKEGVSHERLGMYIIKNESIVKILNSIDINEDSGAGNSTF